MFHFIAIHICMVYSTRMWFDGKIHTLNTSTQEKKRQKMISLLFCVLFLFETGICQLNLEERGKNSKLKLFCSKTHRLSWGQEQRINDNSRKNNKSTKLLLLLLLLLQTVFTLYNHVIVLSIETLFQMYFTTACTAWRVWESNSNEQKKCTTFRNFSMIAMRYRNVILKMYMCSANAAAATTKIVEWISISISSVNENETVV